jgi:hypothetical protein
VKPPDTKATGPAPARRYLHGVGRHFRSNVVAYLALAVAVGSGGSYALAATASTNGTIAVCVDKGSGVMHLAKSPRCGHGQSRIGLSSALDRPTVGALVAPNGGVTSGLGLSIGHAGAGVYDVTITAARCRGALNNAPVVSVNESEPPGGWGAGVFPVAWTMPTGFRGNTFTVFTGVVVAGAFQPRDEAFNLADSCEFAPGT